MTVTTVGYGDFSPVTFQGKIIAVVLMFTGIALIGIVTATLASWIVDQVNLETDRREDAREKEVAKEAAQEAIATSANPEIDLLREEVRELTATVAGLRTELERRCQEGPRQLLSPRIAAESLSPRLFSSVGSTQLLIIFIFLIFLIIFILG